MIDQVGMFVEVLKWVQSQVAANQAGVQVPNEAVRATNGSSLVKELTVDCDGSLRNLIVDVSTAASAGTCSVSFTVNGTAVAASALTINTSAAARKRYARGAIPFKRGDKIGIKITTNGSWDATTSDIVIRGTVLYENWAG